MLVDFGIQPKKTFGRPLSKAASSASPSARSPGWRRWPGTWSGSARSRKLGLGGVRERLREAGAGGAAAVKTIWTKLLHASDASRDP